MSELVILNPRRRRRRNARNAKGQFLPKRRRVNARRRRYHRKRNPIAALAANPRRRRRRNPIAAFAANPRRRRRRSHRMMNVRRRRRHNPRLLSTRGLMNTLTPALVGGAGAVGLDIALSYIPLPAWTQTPVMKTVARLAGAVGLGMLARPLIGRQRANAAMLGALTVVAYGSLKDLAARFLPTVGMSGITAGDDYSDLRLSAYMQNGNGIGFLNPAPMLTSRNGTMGAYMRDSIDPVNQLSGVTNDGM